MIQFITRCQQAGKKVLANFDSQEVQSLSSDYRAVELANITWNLFGGGDVESNIRPLGSGVKLDGFVMTGEKNSTEWLVLTPSLRSHFDQDQSKPYYLALAPDCSLGDPSIGIGIMAQSDFVWPQFTAPGCELYGVDMESGHSGGTNANATALNVSSFADTLERWSTLLIGQSVLDQPPRLYIGMNLPYNQFVPNGTLTSTFNEARKRNISNFGGAMIASGDSVVNNVGGRGNNYLRSLKQVLDCGSEQCWPAVG